MRRIVVDTNVWVSALLNRRGAPAQVLAALVSNRFSLVTSDPLLAELSEVLARPRIAEKYGVTQHDREELIAILREVGTSVSVSGDLNLCRDPDDDVVLETAMKGRADTLVSRDEDIKGDLDLTTFLQTAGVEVMSVARFLTALDDDPPG